MDRHPKFQAAGDGTLLLNFGRYGEEVEVAAISGDGRRVLTVHAVGIAEVWDTTSGEKLGELRPESPLQGTKGTAPVGEEFEVFIEAAALSRDGSTALLGLNDGTAGTFRVSDGTRLATLHPPSEQPASSWSVIRAVAYSPDGAFALVGFSGRSVGVWSEHGDRLIAFLEAPAASKLVGRPFVRDTLVSSVAMSADAHWVFAGNVDMTSTIWDVRSGRVVFEAMDHAEAIVSLFDNAEGFGWATTGGTVWLSRGDASPTKAIASGEHWAEARFAGSSFLTRGFAAKIKRWELSGHHESLCEPAEPGFWADKAETLAFHDGWILYPQGGKRVGVRRGTEAFTIDRDAQLVTARFSPDGKAFATAGWKDDVELWAIPGGRLLHKFPSPGGVGDFAVSPDGAQLAIGELGHGGGGYVRHVYVYETATGHEVHRHAEHEWQVARVAFSPDGHWLASLGDDIVLWELDRRRVMARIAANRSTTGFQFLRDGRLLVLDQGRARVFRGDQKLLEWEAPVRFETRWCVSDDGHTLNIGMNQAVVRFDLGTGAVRGTWAAAMPRPESVTNAIARQFETRAGAALWRTEHGVYLHQSDGPRGWVQPLHLSPEGIVAVPAKDGAAVLRVAAAISMLGLVPFDGKLRASRVVDGEILLVNERGRLFRHRLPAHDG